MGARVNTAEWIPPILYGTAWKEERTEPLVRAALRAGFRGIDTANQRKHYHEAAVGAALRDAFASGVVERDEIFLQTKFTYARGQDHRLPYDANAPLATQVEQSFASSLEHLRVESLDAYLLHGPSSYPVLSDADRDTWRAMEALHKSGRVASLGISNVLIAQLEDLYAKASVKPAIVQNRTFTMPHADAAVRTFCSEHDIAYEGFSLLTAVPHVLAHPTLRSIAVRLGRTPAQVMFQWCSANGMIVLTGTSSDTHMAEDRAAVGEALLADDLLAIERLVTT